MSASFIASCTLVDRNKPSLVAHSGNCNSCGADHKQHARNARWKMSFVWLFLYSSHFAFWASLVWTMPVFAQQSPKAQPGWAGVLESPFQGGWRVIRLRVQSKGGVLGCSLITGYATASTPSNQTWGFRSDSDELTLIMNVGQVEAVAGPEIALNIDGHEVGGVAVSGRPEPANGFSTAIAVVRDVSLQTGIFDLLQRGGMVQFTNGKTTFSAALSKEVASDFQECRRKAGLLS